LHFQDQLLGITQRTITPNSRHIQPKTEKMADAIADEHKAIGDWIRVKRQEKNLSPYHLATEMGVGTALVRSWENGKGQPDKQQLDFLTKNLEFSLGNAR
jgi:DNA-binding transcriptional regulator YiaG